MNLVHVEKLRCPVSGGGSLAAHPFRVLDGRCIDGVLVCPRCRAWFPISRHVLDMLPEARAMPGSRARFFAAHRGQLEDLGLGEPAATAPDPRFAQQEHQREHFNDLARRRDRFSYRAFGTQPFQRAVRSLNFEEWAPLIGPGALVLDVGCGDGLSTFDVARLADQVIGFDISTDQLSLAAARAEQERVRNVSFMVADADAIPLVDDGVDGILCYGTLHHLPDPQRAIEEVARVLRKGGRYLGVENNKTPLRPLFDLLMRLRPIWLEEAGSRPQLGAGELDRWCEGTGLSLRTRAIVFLPPHLCNLLGYRASRRLLRLTDRLFNGIPVIRSWGGLISISGQMLPD
jgi:ubiquinone/menaquinone biosynthesis C-methylase UbiE